MKKIKKKIVKKISSDIKDIKGLKENLNKLNNRFWAGAFLVLILFISISLVALNIYYKKSAQALSANYGKNSGSTLTANEWNNLATDFVSKSGGDSLTGDYTIDGDVCLLNGPCLSSIPAYSCNLLISTPIAAAPGWIILSPTNPSPINDPNVCASEEGCVIKRELIKTVSGVTKLYSSNTWSYTQDPTNDTWTSSYTPSAKVNGDNTNSYIIPPANSGNLRLYDDRVSGNFEVDNDKWAVYDNSTTYGQRIYVCTYN